jgi:hypothetical protein
MTGYRYHYEHHQHCKMEIEIDPVNPCYHVKDMKGKDPDHREDQKCQKKTQDIRQLRQPELIGGSLSDNIAKCGHPDIFKEKEKRKDEDGIGQPANIYLRHRPFCLYKPRHSISSYSNQNTGI